MGKSEYNEYRTLLGESEQPQIILDAEAIYGLLIRAEVMMSKVDRVRYVNTDSGSTNQKHRHHDKTGNRRLQEQARLAHFGS